MSNEIDPLLERVYVLDEDLAGALRKALDRRGMLREEWEGHADWKPGSSLRELLQKLATADETQIDQKITKKLEEIAEIPVIFPGHLRLILDECAFSSLASDFVMQILRIALETLERGEFDQ